MALPTTIRRVTNSADPMTELQHEFDTMLGRFLGGGAPQTTNGRRSAPYAVDVHEDENHLYFEVELPGFKKDNLDITVDNNVLTITAERSTQSKAPEGDTKDPGSKRETLLNERRYTYFSRSFTLPPSVSNEDVQAKLEDGVLHMQLSKREETKPRKVSVA